MSDVQEWVVLAAAIGLLAGLTLLARGVEGYRRSLAVADVVTSRIASLAVGQVRVSGTVERAELALVSPLQSRPCVYYRARVTVHEGRSSRTVLNDERAVGFRVRDASGSIRVFPRGARWDVPPAYHASDGLGGDPPPDLAMRTGPAFEIETTDRSELVARLLTVHRDPGPSYEPALPLVGGGGRTYDEARIEVGDLVTVVGPALPFDQLPDPEGSSVADVAAGGPLAATEDPEIAADLAAATADGSLETDPSEAWGNAAIEGFGIGRPVRAPELDPAATPEPVVDASTAGQFHATFAVPAEEAVLAATPTSPLLVALGEPGTAVQRGRDAFVLGLLGAVLAIVAVVAMAVVIQPGFAE